MDELGAAWAAVEAVIPEGWELHVAQSFWRKGWVAFASQYQLANPGEPGRQPGDPFLPMVESAVFPDAHPTPALALRALAASLTEVADTGKAE